MGIPTISGDLFSVLRILLNGYAGPSMRMLATRASANIVIYTIWRERNQRLFKNERKSNIKLKAEATYDLKMVLSKISKMKKTFKNIEWAGRMGITPEFIQKKTEIQGVS
uniref:Uncharacterized protein n=1 Tax=Kalanchoe fedtschenkoi TaxID=63787 RepID=A0A7N0UHH2_KALFE